MTLSVAAVLAAYASEAGSRGLPPTTPAAELHPSGAVSLAATPVSPAAVLVVLDGPGGGFFAEASCGWIARSRRRFVSLCLPSWAGC